MCVYVEGVLMCSRKGAQKRGGWGYRGKNGPRENLPSVPPETRFIHCRATLS